jgi:hypothetical protein
MDLSGLGIDVKLKEKKEKRSLQTHPKVIPWKFKNHSCVGPGYEM